MNKKRTEIAQAGEFGLIKKISANFGVTNRSSVSALGDDAAVIDKGGADFILVSTDLLLEGIDFDLTYFPLKHLGYKAVVRGCSDILAMNGLPEQILISLGISSKLCVEDIEELYEGIRTACEQYGVDLAGGDTTASVNGLVINISTVGSVKKELVTYRSNANPNDLICITGDLGAAYMGLHLLEREKRALQGHQDPQPDFKGHEYILERQLRPYARHDVVRSLHETGLVPTSMIDLSDGLASDLLQVCNASGCGARIYLDRIPIASQTYEMARELGADPVVAALNGGDDHELMFTVPLDKQELIKEVGGIDIIGHITERSKGAMLVAPDGTDIPLTAPGIALGD